ncbi:hypothetical protein BVRB_3g060890 [Beta vulgaris subsp. vulgaris]|nr:hypothetical protein BVRB_3g060890 [Beta vulgaris subsp. vulgaris]
MILPLLILGSESMSFEASSGVGQFAEKQLVRSLFKSFAEMIDILCGI